MTNFRSPKTVAIVLAVSMALCVVSAYARRIMLDGKTAPDPTLPQAYEQAVVALGAEAKSFHCLSADAGFISDTQGPTEWHFVFYSADGLYREVIVSTKDKVIVRDHPQHTY